MKTLIGLVLLMSVAQVQAGPYIDFGVSYVREIGVSQTASADIGGHTITATVRSVLEVNSAVLLFRAGYKTKNGMHFEFETRGSPEYHMESVQVYKRWEF